MRKIIGAIALLFFLNPIFIDAQSANVEGFVYAKNGTGFLNSATVTVYDGNSAVIEKTGSDEEGKFDLNLPINTDFIVKVRKNGFSDVEVDFSTKGKSDGETLYLKIPMERAPGYIFEVTMAELIDPESEEPADAITDATIEVYNHTKKEESLALIKHPGHTFSFTFEQGNKYTMMIRKEGFFTKRMEVNVAVDGCILCMEGFGKVTPGVNDNLTSGHSAGTLAADINLRKVQVNEAIEIKNIYYSLGKWDIRPDAALELDKLVNILNDNRQLIIELSSHTDSRGTSQSNFELSHKRAKAAVDYLVGQGVDRKNLTPKGYGEIDLKNKCKDGVECEEDEHARNRRTEFKVVGFFKEDPYKNRTLKSIIEDEILMEEIMQLDQTVYQVPEGGVPPSNEEEPEGDADEIPTSQPSNSLTGGDEGTVAIPIEEEETIIESTEPEHFANQPVEEVAIIEEPPVAIEEVVEAIPELEEEVVEIPDVVEEVIEAPEVVEEVVEEIAEAPEIVEEIVEVPDVVEEVVEETTEIDNSGGVAMDYSNPMGSLAGRARKIAKMPANYTGFKVLLISSSKVLGPSHSVLSNYEDVCVQKDGNGGFHYLVGDFRNGNQAQKFLENKVSDKLPSARIIHFQSGVWMN